MYYTMLHIVTAYSLCHTMRCLKSDVSEYGRGRGSWALLMYNHVFLLFDLCVCLDVRMCFCVYAFVFMRLCLFVYKRWRGW